MLPETARFLDRADAGRQLAALLRGLAGEHPLVMALPRGGVAVGFEVARELRAPLDVIVARKLGAPMQPELGIGAIAPGGIRVLDALAIRYLGITQDQIDRVIRAEEAEMERRVRLYRGDRPPPRIEGRTVILVDDGLATGVTARAAARSLRLQRPGRLVLAVPVCAPETAESIRMEVDEVVCIYMPSDFRAVGLWYEDFRQLEDSEVVDLLERARSFAAPEPAPVWAGPTQKGRPPCTPHSNPQDTPSESPPAGSSSTGT